MPRARDIVGAVHTIAVWLLVVSVLLGPVGMGSASAFGLEACGVLCSCDEPQPADHDDCDEPDEHDDESADDEPCSEECSGCAPGVALATPAVLLTAAPASSPDLALAPADAPAAGVCTGVFRPPRSLI